jgi:lipopolysaccharide/colanic/teichoic acid biosynthesis glycosyltransferase
MKEYLLNQEPGAPLLQRTLDIAVSLAALTLCAPALLCLACWIKAVSRGPALRVANRVGQKGRVFGMLGLRTTRLDAAGRERDLPGGAWIRLLLFDKVPQFWNVLRGEMALVGPEPRDETAVRLHFTPLHWRTLDVPPGMTAPRQLRSFPKAAHTARPLELSLEYVDRRSFWLDVRILAAAIWTGGESAWPAAGATKTANPARKGLMTPAR